MDSFWDGFQKEAKVTGAFKSMAAAVKKKPTAMEADKVLDYAKINSPKPQMPPSGTLDYNAMNQAAKAQKGAVEARSGTIDYSGGTPKQTQAPAPVARTPAQRPQMSQTALARIQHATKSKSTSTDWKDALTGG